MVAPARVCSPSSKRKTESSPLLFHKPTKTIFYSEEEAARLPADLITGYRDGVAMVSASYGNILKLVKLGVETPDLMETYDWPHQPGKPPRDTQKIVSNFLVKNPRGYDLSEMRTGKTLASLWAADWIMQRCPGAKALILSDLNATEDAWEYSVRANFPGRRTCTVLHGTAAKRVEKLAAHADFYLLNHDGLRVGYNKNKYKIKGFYQALLSRQDIKIIIVDEATTYKDPRIAASSALLPLAANTPYVWLLTGTPIAQSPEDAYGLHKLVVPDTTLRFSAWRDMVTRADGPFRREVREDATQEVEKLLSPAIRVAQPMAFKARPLETHDVKVALSDTQKKLFQELRRELLIELETGGAITAANQAVLRTKLIQIACGAVYDGDKATYEIEAGPRFKAYKEIINQSRKTVTFVPFINTAVMLSKIVPQSILMPSGATRKQKREVLRRFQTDESVRHLISNAGPIARGIDLTAANTIIWYAPTDKKEQYLQGNERINGVNQKFDRHIYRLSGCAVEEEIYDRIEKGLTMMGAVLKLKEINMDEKKDEDNVAKKSVDTKIREASTDNLIAMVQRLEEHVGKIDEAARKKKAPIEAMALKLRNHIIDRLDRQQIESVRTDSGTAYFSHLLKAKVVNPSAFKKWIIANEAYDFISSAVPSSAVKDFIEGLEAQGKRGPDMSNQELIDENGLGESVAVWKERRLNIRKG